MKKVFSYLLVAVFSMTIFGSGSFVMAEDGENPFSDVSSDHSNFDAISYLKAQDVLVGYSDGTYKPWHTINRAEFLKIAMMASGYEISDNGCNNYSDVPANEWYTPFVCSATIAGLVSGYPDGTFRPADPINFAEASKIVVNALDVPVVQDVAGEWFATYVESLAEFSAVPVSVVAFEQLLDRGEMAEIVWRVISETDDMDSNNYQEIESGEASAKSGNLTAFTSCGELQAYVEDNTYGDNDDIDFGEEVSDVAEPSPSEAEDTSSGSADYSKTNIQVEGVDEADIVKTDGEYIYLVSQNDVRVVKAYPPTQMTELSMLEFDKEFYPSEVYVDGDRLVVLGTSYNYVNYFIESDESFPVSSSGTLSEVYIFDISNPENIQKSRHLAFEGSYSDSRKVDNMLYLVANKYKYSYSWQKGDSASAEQIIPLYSDSANASVAPVTGCADVWHVPNAESTQYLVVAGIPTDDPDGAVSEQVVLGSSGDIYATRENLYVAEPKYGYYYWYDDAGSSEEETIIHKFSLNEGDISYEGKGNVPGTILNQFSMDENDGYFRIATTVGDVWSGNSLNNLYVLNENLTLVGAIEGIAPGEKIYSVRFVGDRGYMVTFKKVDPLFVLGLSDPYNPEILGKLKIPGFSDYLHPYDENHIIGFGLDAIDASEEDISERDLDFAWYQGIKIAMFDVSDVENPVELHKVIIGDRGTESPLNYDHKALLFDKEKGIFAFPVTVAEIPEEVKNDPATPDNTYGDYVFQGAYVYNVSIEDGFDLKGTITHYSDDEVAEKSGYYWSGIKDIERILYIGNYFYTTAQAMVMASNMDSFAEVNRVEFEGVEDNDYYWYE